MDKIFAMVGGRKMALLLIALILVALKDVVGFDDEIINKIVLLAIGGSGAIAVEDGMKNLIKKE